MRLRLISPLRPGPDPGRRRRLLVPDHADPPRRLDRRAVSLRELPLVRAARAGARARARARRRARTAPARRTCSSRCTSARRASRRGRAPTRELIRFGEDAGADPARRGARRRRRFEIDVGAVGAARGSAPSVNGARLRAAEQLRSELADARLHARPAGDRQGGPGGAARVLRPRRSAGCCPARASLPADYAAALGAAERRAATRGDGLSSRTRSRRGRSRSPRSAPSSSRRAREALDAARPGLRRAARRARPGGRAARLRGRAADGGSARGAARPRPRARRDRARPAPARRLDRRPADATCAASARRASSGLAVLALLLAEAALIAERRGEPPLLLLDDVLSELDPGRRRVLARAGRGPRPDADHRDDAPTRCPASRPSSSRSTPARRSV